MKWKKDVPNKSEFVKLNTLNFLANEIAESHGLREVTPKRNCEGKILNNHSVINVGESERVAGDRRTEPKIMSETITLIESRTEDSFNGPSPKKYISKCFIKPVTMPYWYTEGVTLKIGSTKRNFSEKIHFKNQLKPFYWSETMSTEVKTCPNCVLSELNIPVEDFVDNCHFISLEPQQNSAIKTSNLTEL